ncbi:hypothetical protein BS78_06G005200 [Paspalum vaginatum]|nr:hypothetical protein BS78_06G005200 [Paspalum vaginatum]
MMTTTRDEQQLPTSSATTMNAPAVATLNAKLMVATSRGDCQGLKDLMNKEDATSMVVVMATNQAEAPKLPTLASIHPLLAAAACQGNWKELNFLLNRSAEASMMPSEEFIARLAAYTTTTATTAAAADIIIEEGWAASLLMGVTVEGDTPLHLVAANGDGNNYKDCADLIHGKDKHLLSKQNKEGDTPLHCAARARRSEMVSHLIDLARGDGILEGLLRTENNSKETAFHQVVLVGDNDMVKRLLKADPELACFPKQGGTSPLYLAILLKEDGIAKTLHDESKDKALSYSGPNGQNALHAAVLRGPVVTQELLGWNKSLATGRDEKGSTPLHFAIGYFEDEENNGTSCVCSQVLEANEAALFQPDKDGLAPIHVAATVGANRAISMFVRRCGSSAGLRDAKGRTFLHVAVVEKQVRMVCSACRNPSLAWILNMQDDEGNTALHLAVQAVCLRMFWVLFGNRQVKLNLVNNKGQTPLDIAWNQRPLSLVDNRNNDFWILNLLILVGASNGVYRLDHFKANYKGIHGVNSGYQISRLQGILKDSTQSRSIGSVLITTVTFGATFAMPGGYKQDDHTDGPH